MRLVYADAHQQPTHWLRNALFAALLAVIVFAAALALAAR